MNQLPVEKTKVRKNGGRFMTSQLVSASAGSSGGVPSESVCPSGVGAAS